MQDILISKRGDEWKLVSLQDVSIVQISRKLYFQDLSVVDLTQGSIKTPIATKHGLLSSIEIELKL